MDNQQLRQQRANEFGEEVDMCIDSARQYLIGELRKILNMYPQEIEPDASTCIKRMREAESLSTLMDVIKEYHSTGDKFRQGFYESHAYSVLFAFSELWNSFLWDVGTGLNEDPLIAIQHELTQMTQTMDKAGLTKPHEIMIRIFLQQANLKKVYSERAINWLKTENREFQASEIEENMYASCQQIENIIEFRKIRSTMKKRVMKRKKIDSELESDAGNDFEKNYEKTMKLLVKACVALRNIQDDQLINKIEMARGKHTWLAWALPVGE